MKLYTKRGDRGETDLLGGGRVGKDDRRVEAYGEVDELNAYDPRINQRLRSLLGEDIFPVAG